MAGPFAPDQPKRNWRPTRDSPGFGEWTRSPRLSEAEFGGVSELALPEEARSNEKGGGEGGCVIQSENGKNGRDQRERGWWLARWR